MTIVCVGTPSAPNGGLSTDLSGTGHRADRSGAGHQGWLARRRLPQHDGPGTCERILIPILERTSGKRVGIDFGVCVNPEFLREGSSVKDFLDPPKTVVGESDERSGAAVMTLYEGLPGPRFRVPLAVAEMTKYVDNGFHALKVGFANEIGAVCAAFGLDSHDVMDVFVADTKLNISSAYLRPGFAFGGSCLPKDLRALTYAARRARRGRSVAVQRAGLQRGAHCGAPSTTSRSGSASRSLRLSFKSGTDDLRESPMVELAERLIGKGFELRIYDESVALSRLMGANKAYIEEHLPHLGDVLTGAIDTVLEHGEVFIVGSRGPTVVAAVEALADECPVIDLVRLPNVEKLRTRAGYRSIAW